MTRHGFTSAAAECMSHWAKHCCDAMERGELNPLHHRHEVLQCSNRASPKPSVALPGMCDMMYDVFERRSIQTEHAQQHPLWGWV